jgi:hypothetical protein
MNPFQFNATTTIICWKILVYFAPQIAKANIVGAYLPT